VCIGVYVIARCNSRRKIYFAEYSKQSRSLFFLLLMLFRSVHFIIHTGIFLWLILKSWLFNPALVYDCLVISETRTTSKLNQKRFRQIDNEQHTSHTDPCTGYVQILYHHLNVILRLSCWLSNSSTKLSKSVFQLVPFNLMYISVTQSFTGNGMSGKCFH